jgi:hypothetical protein
LRRQTAEENAVRPHESLMVNSDDGSPVVRYERIDGNQSVSVEAVEFQQILIRRDDPARVVGGSFEFHQPAMGDVRLVVRNGDASQTWSAPSVWHLVLTERAVCERTLLSVLDLMRPGWDISRMADEVVKSLCVVAEVERPVARSELDKLVRELNAAQFQRREAADRKLRALGPAVLPYLDRLATAPRGSARGLSSEQRSRILRIRETLTAGFRDTPERVAQWLVDDEQVWLALQQQEDPERRQIASIRLAALHP